MLPTDLWPFAFSALCAAALMPLVMRVRSIGRDAPFQGVQKVHAVPTSRLGGAIILVAYLAAWTWAVPTNFAVRTPAVYLVLSALPVVLVGLWEDISGRVHPWYRLAASVLSGALATWLLAGVVNRLDIPILDGWLRYAIIALPLTWFMVAGACNAVNLIDGAHGLAGGTVLMMFAGLAVVAAHVGDGVVLAQTLPLLGAVLGFLLWNYPGGKVFLGDAGAYFFGFMYAQLSIQLVRNNPQVSAWFVIALAAYPIVETLYSIYRRKLLLGTDSMQADAGHLHSLLFRRLQVRYGMTRRWGQINRANAQVAPRLWLHGAICLFAALLLWQHSLVLMAFFALYGAFYIFCYRSLLRRPRPKRWRWGAAPLSMIRRAEDSRM